MSSRNRYNISVGKWTVYWNFEFALFQQKGPTMPKGYKYLKLNYPAWQDIAKYIKKTHFSSALFLHRKWNLRSMLLFCMPQIPKITMTNTILCVWLTCVLCYLNNFFYVGLLVCRIPFRVFFSFFIFAHFCFRTMNMFGFSTFAGPSHQSMPNNSENIHVFFLIFCNSCCSNPFETMLNAVQCMEF